MGATYRRRHGQRSRDFHLDGRRSLRGGRHLRHDRRRLHHHGQHRLNGYDQSASPRQYAAARRLGRAVLRPRLPGQHRPRRDRLCGRQTSIEGGFASFNAVEIRQATVRVADSLLEYNADGWRGTPTTPTATAAADNGPATIFVRGAQPVIVDNIFLNNDLDPRRHASDGAAVISIDVNSLNSDLINDWGRSTGPSGRLHAIRRQLRPPGPRQQLPEQRPQRHAGPRRRAFARSRSGTTPTSSTSWRARSSFPTCTPTAACGCKAATTPAWW